MNETAVMSMSDFCTQEIESFGKDADHLQITALCKVLNTSLDVVYLDGQQESGLTGFTSVMATYDEVIKSIDSRPCNVISFKDEVSTHYIGSFLYRPGHYDLLTVKS